MLKSIYNKFVGSNDDDKINVVETQDVSTDTDLYTDEDVYEEPSENDEDYDSSSKDGTECKNIEDSTLLLKRHGKLLDSYLVCDGIEFSLYKIKMSEYTSFSETWKMNRGVDESHVDKLYTDLKSMKYPHFIGSIKACLLYTSPSPRDRQKSRMPSSA